MRGILTVVLIGALVVGCKGKTETARDTDSPPPGEETKAKPAAAKKKKLRAEAVSAKAAEELVAAWLAAQNSGDFAAYEALYAAELIGIKRVGEKETMFDRKGWLADRRRMFKKKMAVDAAALSVSTRPGFAVALFTQSWSSGSFKDVGPKQLVIVREPGGVRIAREEMLRSTVAPALLDWAAARAGAKASIESDALPPAVRASLEDIGRGLVIDGEDLKSVDGALPLSAQLVVFEMTSDNDDEDPPGWDRGATSHLVLLRKTGGRFVVAGATSEEGTGYSLEQLTDLDGDGAADAIFSWSWYHDHEGADGLAAVMTASRTIADVQTKTGGGEAGYSSVRELTDVCALRIDGRILLVTTFVDTESEPEDEDDPYESESIETVGAGASVAPLDGKKGDSLYGHWVGSDDDSSAFQDEADFGHHAGSEAFDVCGGDADPSASIPGEAIGLAEGKTYLVRGLAVGKAAALTRAPTPEAKRRVVKIGGGGLIR